MIKQIGFAYQSAVSAAEIQRNLCNSMNNAQPISVSSVKSVVIKKGSRIQCFSGRKILFHGRWNIVPRPLERFCRNQQVLRWKW